ncbi:hypothetical protein BDR03DRAFT_1017973 [Suillus americanus]|nr:hypothetical protein BDR03DRAFT_1017973 [Suillus americanus]
MGRVPSPAPTPIVSKRSGRRICMPARFADCLPGSATHLAHMPPSDCQQCGHHGDRAADQFMNPQPCAPSPPQSEHEDPFPLIPFKTEPDEAGLYRIYSNRPSIPPNENTLKSVTNAPTLAGTDWIPNSSRITEGLLTKEISQDDLYAAFFNPTSGLLMAYHYSGTGQQSVAELQCLTKFIGDPLFDSGDANSFSHTWESKNIDAYLENKSNPFHEEYGWCQSTVKIRLPKEGEKWHTEADAPELEIPGVHHRLLTDIIKSIFQDYIATMFNTTPYHEFWKSPDGRDIEVFSEAYSSPEMIETYAEINNLPREAGGSLEHTVASLMFWSDATHLANFGDASLWPFYLYFGNQSKYTQGKPTASVCHHVAYIPSLPEDLQDQYRGIFGEPCTSQVYTHCKHKLMQAIWALLLDEKFMHAYEYGMVGAPVDGTRIKNILNDKSLVPTRNSLFEKLSPHGFNRFHIFVVDELHGFELGVWKANFTHLMRILHAAGGDAIQKLNERYCTTPTFGRGTIRKFNSNVSAMKRLATRDFEDLLQCALPVFEGLLPDDDNNMVLDLLFDLATWQGFTKLCMHTEDTLKFFNNATAVLGQTLPHKYATRGRREAALASKLPGADLKGKGKAVPSGPKHKRLNLKTYKYHALGDYPDTIRQFGTTNSFSTQPGELQHQHKMLVSENPQREEEHSIKEGNAESQHCQRERTSPANHYHISKYARASFDLTEWLNELPEDNQTVLDFIPRLKDHLLARLRGIEYTGDKLDFTDEDCTQIIIANNKIYEHSVLWINYTTYDLRREQDSLNPCTHADVMVLSHENDDARHPYWYAQIIQIFHVDVWDCNDMSMEKPCQIDFVLVRWFGHKAYYQSGWSAKCLHHIGFLRGEDSPFGFLDPDVIIQGVHLIPAFESGKTDELLPNPFVQPEADLNEDWLHFYVNMFVDQDMFMHYQGGGIGHAITCKWDEFLQSDGVQVMNEQAEELENEAGEEDRDEDKDEDEGEGEEEEEEDQGEIREDKDDKEEEDPDRIEVDEGESELDDDFLIVEGYSTL